MDEAQECDRLVMMADDRVVAEGEVAGIIGSARVTVVGTPDWAGAFETIERAGKVAGLVGRTLRVSGASPEEGREILAAIPARIYPMPATLEERFLDLTRPMPETAAPRADSTAASPPGHGD
jgi:hypothetical protein